MRAAALGALITQRETPGERKRRVAEELYIELRDHPDCADLTDAEVREQIAAHLDASGIDWMDA